MMRVRNDMLYEKAKELVKNNKNYRVSEKFYKGHKFEFFTYILPDYNDMKENNSFFMRGFCVQDSKIEILGLRKFFNIGENPDWNLESLKNLVITEKFDGTLIIPFLLDNKIEFRTKMSFDDPFVSEARRAFNLLTETEQNFILEKLKNSENIFCELISPLDKHVVNYNGELSLKIFAYTENGKLKPYVPVILHFKDVNDLKNFLETQKNFEGYVLYDLENDKQYKLKSSEYCLKHRAKESIQNYEVLHLIINEEIDDLRNLFNDLELNYIDYLTHEIINYIINKQEFFNKNYVTDRKEFALKMKNFDDFALNMSLYKFNDVKVIKEYIIKNTQKKTDFENFLKKNNIKNFNEFIKSV